MSKEDVAVRREHAASKLYAAKAHYGGFTGGFTRVIAHINARLAQGERPWYPPDEAPPFGLRLHCFVAE